MSASINMVKIGSILKNLLSSQEKLSTLNKEVKEIKAEIKNSKEAAFEFMQENKSTVLDVGTHEIKIKEKCKKPPLNKGNQEAWLTEYFNANDMDASHAKKIVEFFVAKIAEGTTETPFLSVTKTKAKKRKAPKKKETDEPVEKKAKVENEAQPEAQAATEAEIDELF